jgi:hypothetical protein
MDYPGHEQIALRAYEIWEQRGWAHGGHETDWYQAEHELLVEPDMALVGLARKAGAVLGAAVAFVNDPLEKLKHNSGK